MNHGFSRVNSKNFPPGSNFTGVILEPGTQAGFPSSTVSPSATWETFDHQVTGPPLSCALLREVSIYTDVCGRLSINAVCLLTVLKSPPHKDAPKLTVPQQE